MYESLLLSCSCRVDYSDERHMYDQLSRSHRARIIKVWVGCVCLFWLCCSKWWCTQTFTYDLTDDRRGTHSAFWLYSRLLSLLTCTTSSLSHTGTFMFHLGDDRCHAMHSLLYHFPHGTEASFYVSFLTQIHTPCTEANVGHTAFFSVFHGHDHSQ